jgi:hypothetical protein
MDPGTFRTLGDITNSLGEITNVLSGLSNQQGELQQAYMADLGRLKVAEDVTEDWLQIPFRFVDIPIGNTSVMTRTISGDGPFDLIEVTATALGGAALVANTAFRFRIKEGESVGRTLTQDGEFVDCDNSAGTAQRPYIIKGRRRYRANIAIQVEIVNAYTDYNLIEIVLHGIKVFVR